MQDRVACSMLDHSGQLLPASTEPHQYQASSIESFPDHKALLELDLDYEALLDFCNRYSFTTCGVFQTAWAIVVSCYAGVEDVSFIYTTSDGRSFHSKQGRGRQCFCRAHIDSKNSLFDALSATKKNVGEVLDESSYTDEERQNEPSHTDTLAFKSGLRVSYQLEGHIDAVIQDEILPKHHVTAEFFIKDNASILLSLRAHATRFSAVQVDDLTHTLAKTLTEITKAHPQCLIEDLDMCSQHDLKRIMSWNQPTPGHAEGCFHWQFETIARKTPDAAAICSWDRDFTYRELNTVSTKLANKLRHVGVLPGMFVGICFNKSSMAYVCMLSILKAGGAFVAIDPSYPVSRIQSIVEATRALIVMAEPAHCHLFDGISKHTMLIDTKIVDELPSMPNLSGPQPTPSDIAYAVFTSGSTGFPKGIMIEHRSLYAAALALASPMGIDSSSRVFQFAAYTFDVSYGDTFVTWAQGGCICVPSEHERINDIPGAMVRMSVNNACLIPSVARMLRPGDVPCLKVLNLGAEALLKDNLDTWAEHVTLSVVYGPSECTVWCASQPSLKVDSPASIIGRGVGALLWVTSATNHDRLCPIGCVGELLIEGPGLARGYLDPEQTRHVFIENPSWAHTEPGQRRRFYKTGDLVRYRPDGILSFIGRKDTQIKLHGRRIELGEIEYHLSCHELLKQSMVLLPSAGRYRGKLVAIIVFNTSTASSNNPSESNPLTVTTTQTRASDITNIKTFLSSRLPFYMLPQDLISVNSIPLMTSGKLNRIQTRQFIETLISPLPDNNAISNTPPPPHPQPNTRTNPPESRLQHLWSQALSINIQDIDTETSFTTLGGDSFTAMDLAARCTAEGYTVTAADLLQDMTIRQMATSSIRLKTTLSSKVTGPVPDPVHEDEDDPSQRIENQHKHATSRPLVLRPIWWDTDPSAITPS